MSEVGTKYILEYRYDNENDSDWREEDVFNNPTQAHCAFTDHVKTYAHIIARVRKVRYVTEESIIASFQPISSEEYEDE